MHCEKVKKKARGRCGLRAAWGGYPGNDISGKRIFHFFAEK
jgi:hypothetical protein